MSSPRAWICARPLQVAKPCAFCHVRQFTTSVRGDAATKPYIRSSRWAKPHAIGPGRTYATPARSRLDVQRLRTDVDERARLGFYALSQQQGALLMDRVKANSIAKEFFVNQKNMDDASNIKRLASKYNVSVEDLASLAIVTFRIPDLTDTEKKATLPPSRHKPLATSMLKGCAQLEDPLAVVQILSAVLLAGSSDGPTYRELASFFSQKEVPQYRLTLEKIGAKATKIELGPEALTLQGLFLENEGKGDKAESVYTEAVQRVHFKHNPKSRHPMQIPLVAPWNALGNLLKTSQDPGKREQAKAYFKRGALEGDDPYSYYELAAFEDRSDPKWLQYTSKAAASGHRQAAVDLADFYQEASSPDSSVVSGDAMRKGLNWLLQWKQGSAAKLAREWLQAASNMGHKPSTLQLAEHHEAIGDREGANGHFRRLAEPPNAANQVEKWPQLVQLAKKRLAGMKA